MVILRLQLFLALFYFFHSVVKESQNLNYCSNSFIETFLEVYPKIFLYFALRSFCLERLVIIELFSKDPQRFEIKFLSDFCLMQQLYFIGLY